MESALCLFQGHRIHSGIFYGPWCPVYGLGILLVIIMFRYIEKAHFAIWLNIVLMFLSAFVMLTFLECIGGILIEKIFGITFWDYTPLKWNIGKYIALEISLAWGILSVLLYYFVIPWIDKLIKVLPTWLLFVLIPLSILDIILSSILLLQKK